MSPQATPDFLKEKFVSPSCTGNVLVDTKLCLYLLFAYHFEGFRTAYLRSVTEDAFGTKDYDAFSKVCKKFIKTKISNTPLEAFVCKNAWEPSEAPSWNFTRRGKNWIKSEQKKAQTALNEMLCQFFIYMTEFCIERDYTFNKSDETKPQAKTTGTKKKQSTAEKEKISSYFVCPS